MALTVLGRERAKLLDRRAMVLRRMEAICDEIEAGGDEAALGAEFDRLERELNSTYPKLRKLEAAMRKPTTTPTTTMTDAEFDALLDEPDPESDRLRKSIELANTALPTEAEWRAIHGDSTPYPYRSTATPAAATWVDKDGKQIRMLSSKQKLSDFTGKPQLSIGRLIKGMVSGNWNGAEAERLAMASNWNTTGGFLVKEEFSSRIIDLARNQSVAVQAGAQTIPMMSDVLTMARQTGDPTLEFKPENAAFGDTSITFDAITFTARVLGNIITLSRELASDAPNSVQAIENSLAAALAVSLDGFALEGDTSAEITGLARHANVGETGSVAAVSWEDFLTAIFNIENANHTPTAYVIHPKTKDALARLTTGDGTNAAKNWLPAPPDVAALRRLVSKNCNEARAYIGNFAEMAFAVREDALVEVSTEAGDSFAKHQIVIKITWRGGWNLLRPAAFHRLAGITYS